MTALTQEISLKTAALPEFMQYEVLDFIGFLYAKLNKAQANETVLLSEMALAIDWNREEEDEAWTNNSSRDCFRFISFFQSEQLKT